MRKYTNFLGKMLSRNIAIDLGTANTLVYVQGEGIVLSEASVVAIKNSGNVKQILAVGDQAKNMIGRTPIDLVVSRPLKDGVIADFEAAAEMITHFVQKVQKSRRLINPQIVICVPYGATQVERKTIQESAKNAGAREVFLIEEPMAAAIGAGLEVSKASGIMVVDIGGGTTEVAVISLGGIVHAQSCKVGGDKMDEDIMSYIKKKFNLLIGETTAENIKKQIGSATYVKSGDQNEEEMVIRGLDLLKGIPRDMVIDAKEVAESLHETVGSIIVAIKEVLEKTPPQLAADISISGIMLTGGGSLLRNIAKVIEEHTNLQVHLSDHAQECVVRGCGKAIDELEILYN